MNNREPQKGRSTRKINSIISEKLKLTYVDNSANGMRNHNSYYYSPTIS